MKTLILEDNVSTVSKDTSARTNSTWRRLCICISFFFSDVPRWSLFAFTSTGRNLTTNKDFILESESESEGYVVGS